MKEVLAGSFLDQLPARLISDKTYDSDLLDEQLATEYGIELIAPTGGNEAKLRTVDHCAATRGAAEVERLSPGCTTSAAWSLAGSAMPKTASASSSSAALKSC